MNTRKHMAKISYGLIAALIIVIAGLLVYQKRLIRQMSQNERQTPPAAAISDSKTLAENKIQTTAMADGGREKSEDEVDTLRYQLEASEEELDMAREDLANKKGLDEAIQEEIAMHKKVRENPTLNNRMRRQSEDMLNKEYGALFESLGLTDEQLKALKTLMVNYNMQDGDVSIELHDPSLTEEERERIQQQLGSLKDEYEKQMKDMLGAENYEMYNAYEERAMERGFLNSEDNPVSAGLGLSDETEQELIDAMYEARKDVEAEYGFIPFPEDNYNQYLDQLLETNDRYIESARRVLTESQFKQFEARINEEKELIKLAQMSQGGGDDESQ